MAQSYSAYNTHEQIYTLLGHVDNDEGVDLLLTVAGKGIVFFYLVGIVKFAYVVLV